MVGTVLLFDKRNPYFTLFPPYLPYLPFIYAQTLFDLLNSQSVFELTTSSARWPISQVEVRLSQLCVLNREIHHKVFIYVYLQFKSEFKENYLASTSL